MSIQGGKWMAGLVAGALVLSACSDPQQPWGAVLGWSGATGMVVEPRGTVTVALSDYRTAGAIEQFGLDGERRFSQQLDFASSNIAADGEGGFVAVGVRRSSDRAEALVARTDGHELTWTTTLHGRAVDGGETFPGPRFVLADPGGIWVAGEDRRSFLFYPNPPRPQVRPFVARLDRHGGLRWQTTFEGEGSVQARGLALGADGTAVLGVSMNGSTLDVGADHYERDQAAIVLIGISSEGEVLFSHDVGESLDDDISDMTDTRDGSTLVTGTRWRHDLPVTAIGTFVSVASSRGEVTQRTNLDHGIQMTDPRSAACPRGDIALGSVYSDANGGGRLLLADFDSEGEELRRRTFADGGYSLSGIACLPGGRRLLLGAFQERVQVGPVELTSTQPYDSYLILLTD